MEGFHLVIYLHQRLALLRLAEHNRVIKLAYARVLALGVLSSFRYTRSSKLYSSQRSCPYAAKGAELFSMVTSALYPLLLVTIESSFSTLCYSPMWQYVLSQHTPP